MRKLYFLFFHLFICRIVQILRETICGAMLKTQFLAGQIEFATQYPQSDDLHHKLTVFLTNCINILSRFFKILNCPEDKFFFISGNVKCQVVTLADMLMQSIDHLKKKARSAPLYSMEKCMNVLWQILTKMNCKLTSYLDKVEYWIY